MSLVKEWDSKQHFMQPQHSICVAIMCLEVEAYLCKWSLFVCDRSGRMPWKESTVNSLLHDDPIEQLSKRPLPMCSSVYIPYTRKI